jgi:hypothetical protein
MHSLELDGPMVRLPDAVPVPSVPVTLAFVNFPVSVVAPTFTGGNFTDQVTVDFLPFFQETLRVPPRVNGF